MKFPVNILRAAERDFNGILEYIAARSKAGAVAWARAFDKALTRLEESADSCPLAAENEQVEFEVREILFKTRRGLIYRILFTIRENTVYYSAHSRVRTGFCLCNGDAESGLRMRQRIHGNVWQSSPYGAFRLRQKIEG